LQAAQGGGGMNLGMMLAIMVVFFLFMIWPQMRKAKKAKAFNQGLQKGQKIVTTGGVHGKISSVGETWFVIQLEEGIAKIEKSAISMEMTAAHYGAAAEDAKEVKEARIIKEK
jgi:preprotein translocase subunit YajC